MKFTNSEKANALLNPPYRAGWCLKEAVAVAENQSRVGRPKPAPIRTNVSLRWPKAGVWSLKGSHKSAQGNALGIEGRIQFTSPERA